MTWKEWLSDTWQRWKKWASGWSHLGPHFVVGDANNPYLHRWYVLPRFDFLSVYVHKFLRDDDDRALHDHPWKSVSFLFRGQYIEVTADGKETLYKAPSVIWRPNAAAPHRIKLIDGKPAWTLFVAGRRERDWGFHCQQGWVPWQKFVEKTAAGNTTGKGCEQ